MYARVISLYVQANSYSHFQNIIDLKSKANYKHRSPIMDRSSVRMCVKRQMESVEKDGGLGQRLYFWRREESEFNLNLCID